jgi:hypothetical protein
MDSPRRSIGAGVVRSALDFQVAQIGPPNPLLDVHPGARRMALKIDPAALPKPESNRLRAFLHPMFWSNDPTNSVRNPSDGRAHRENQAVSGGAFW